jgi:quercetin dioxygenase-like cupin family protein
VPKFRHSSAHYLATDLGEAVDTWDINSLDVQTHQPKVLRSDAEARVIAINLPAGERLSDHQVHERAYLIVTEGEIEMSSEGDSKTGGAGFLAHFDKSERHEVTAKSDARVVLVLAPWPGPGHSSQRAGGGPPE